MPAINTHHASAAHSDAMTRAMASKELDGFDGHGRAQIGATETKTGHRNAPYPGHGRGLGQSCPRSGDLHGQQGKRDSAVEKTKQGLGELEAELEDAAGRRQIRGRERSKEGAEQEINGRTPCSPPHVSTWPDSQRADHHGQTRAAGLEHAPGTDCSSVCSRAAWRGAGTRQPVKEQSTHAGWVLSTTSVVQHNGSVRWLRPEIRLL